jgi:2-oxoglutarate dehydrogenase E2 component (dihydrolipoamide succinyltransferase)
MTVEIKVPSFGESIKEGVLVRWFKKNGDYVKTDEDLLEIETDKATNAVPSPASGVLQITVPEGRKVLIGAIVGQIDESAPAPTPSHVEPTPPSAPASTPLATRAPSHAIPATPVPTPITSADPTSTRTGRGTPDGSPTPPMSPAARILVAEHKVDPREITPTGRGGVIVKDDVLTHLQTKPQSPVPEPGTLPRTVRQKMSPIRQRIAERLMASQQHTATLTTFNEVDMTAVIELRNRFKDRFQKKHDVTLGFMPFFVRACVEALKAFPVVNARIDGDEIVYQNFYNISIAVASDKGLFVPVLKNCDRLSFAEIEKGIADLATRAREGKIKPEDLADGTFTITNGGVFGSMMSTPILNPPQSAILGMHAITKRPVVVNDQIVIRPMMYLALSYDHRLIDGREAVQFLVRIKEFIENPGLALLDL